MATPSPESRSRLRMSGRDKKRRRESLLRRNGNRCTYCPALLTSETATLDHIVPKNKGGRDCLTNLVLACFPCNRAKGDKSFVRFVLEG